MGIEGMMDDPAEPWLLWVGTADLSEKPPPRPVLVRVPKQGGFDYHVATKADGLWRMHGAADRLVYGVEAWAEVPE